MHEREDCAEVMTRPDGTHAARRYKLLIVDDERAITRIMRTVAKELGFDTCEVNDSSQATDAFIEFRPDMLALDLIMPGKDGIDILNEVLVVDPSVQLLLMSGYGEAGLRLAESVSKFHAGNDAVMLRKPFRVDMLRQTLQHLAAATAN